MIFFVEMRAFANKWFSRWAEDENKEKIALQLTAKDFLSATDKQLQVLISTKKCREVRVYEQDS